MGYREVSHLKCRVKCRMKCWNHCLFRDGYLHNFLFVCEKNGVDSRDLAFEERVGL